MHYTNGITKRIFSQPLWEKEMAHVTVTLTADMALSDNGSDFENETGTNANDIQTRARARVTAYRKKGDTVSFNNQLDQGVQQIAVVGNAILL